MALPLSLERLFMDLVHRPHLSIPLRQVTIIFLELLEFGHHRCVLPIVLSPPLVAVRPEHAVLAAPLPHGPACLCPLDDVDDLDVGVSELLHVDSL
jgi:hypothetical protein